MKKEMNNKIAFLKNFRLFHNVNAYKLQKFIHTMKTQITYMRGQCIYCEGEKNIDGIYLIEQGEFEVS